MQTKVSRNEPCPCGSGKKYKKCCGLQKTVSITSIIEKEIMDIQAQVLHYAMERFEIELDDDFSGRIDRLLVEDEDEMEYYLFVHTLWFTSFVPVDHGKTILQHFIEEKSRMIQRPKVKEILQTWTNPRPIAGRVVGITSDTMAVRDAFTNEVHQIKLLEEYDVTANAFLFAILVPFGTEWIVFPTIFDMEGEDNEKEELFLRKEFGRTIYDNPIEFLQEQFLDLMNTLPYAMLDYGSGSIDWKNDAHREIAVLFEEKMKEGSAPDTIIATGLLLWFKYCEKDLKLIKKPETYAAAVHYLNLKANPMLDLTKKEIANLYGISPSTLGTAIRHMEFDLYEELMELKGMYLEQIIEDLELGSFGFPDDDWDDEEDDDDGYLF